MKRGSSRSYAYFRFTPERTLEVILPGRLDVDIERVIRERLPWIARQYDQMVPRMTVLSHDRLLYAGKYFSIEYADDVHEEIVLNPVNGKAVVHGTDPRHLKELVRRWFLRESSAYAIKKVREFSPIVGVRPKEVDVREIGKWGYCTHSGRISVSWQLIALPEHLREYVILHELTHLREFNHSPAFHRRLGSVCPDFKQREKELDLVVPYDRVSSE